MHVCAGVTNIEALVGFAAENRFPVPSALHCVPDCVPIRKAKSVMIEMSVGE